MSTIIKNIKNPIHSFDDFLSSSPKLINFLLKFKKYDPNPSSEIYIENKKYIVQLATKQKDFYQVFRLRSKCFKRGVLKNIKDFSLENDCYDKFSDYLIVKDKVDDKVLATYRLIPSIKTNDYYSSSEFDLSKLLELDGIKIELGRACTDKEKTSPIIFALLWKGLLEYANRVDAKYLFGCSSIFCGEEYATAIFNDFLEKDFVHNRIISMPKYKYLPKSNIKKKGKTVVNVKDIKIPSLIKSYLNAGAKICSFPAYDKDFKCVDLLTLFNIKDINNRYEEKFKS